MKHLQKSIYLFIFYIDKVRVSEKEKGKKEKRRN